MKAHQARLFFWLTCSLQLLKLQLRMRWPHFHSFAKCNNLFNYSYYIRQKWAKEHRFLVFFLSDITFEQAVFCEHKNLIIPDYSVPLMHHDPSDIGSISLIRKRKIRFWI